MKKRIFIFISIFIILISAGWFIYTDWKKEQLEEMVYEHLVEEQQIPKHEILTLSAFNANLPGEKKYLVAVTLNDDPNTYYYYRMSNGSIALESYTDENNEEHVSP